MNEKKEITYATAHCISESVKVLKEISCECGWEDNNEFIKNLFMLSTIGYIITQDEYKEELREFIKDIGNKIYINQKIIKQAKRYANITKKKE